MKEIVIKRAVPGGLWIVYRDEDEMVPIRDTIKFVEFLKENRLEVGVEIYAARGEGHGFDHEIPLLKMKYRDFLGNMLRRWLEG